MSEWQRIETAPKDGTEVLALLVYEGGACCVVATFVSGYEHVRDGWQSARSGHEYREGEIQWWMPLSEFPIDTHSPSG